MFVQAKVEIERPNDQRGSDIKLKTPFILRYGIAVLAVVAALIINRFLDVNMVGAPAMLFLCALMFSALYSGTKPALLAMPLAVAAFAYYFVTPVNAWAIDVREVPRLLLFVLASLFVISLSASQKRAAESLRRARDLLAGTVEELQRTNQALRMEDTERKLAENKLREQKETLQKVFDYSPVLISFFGEDGRIKLVNREWERTIGWSVEEIEAQNVDVMAECYPDPQDRRKAQKFIAATSGEWADFKVKVRDGRVLDTAWANVRLSDGTSVGIGQDITQRKLADEALDERLRFETLLTELSAAFANLSPNEVDREIDKWLQRLVEFLGVDRASFLQFPDDWTMLFRSHSYTIPGIEPLPPPPIELKNQFPWITDQLRRGITVKWSRVPDDMLEEAAKEKEYAARLGVKSGLNIPVRVGGTVICAITFTSILTYRDWPDAMVGRLRLVGEIFAAAVERKRSEEELRKEKEILEKIFDNIPVLIGFVGEDGRVKLVNREWERTMGWTLKELQDQNVDIFAEAYPDLPYRQKVLDFVAAATGEWVDLKIKVRDGRLIDAACAIVQLSDGTKVAIAQDITERKQAEEKLRQSESQLAEAQDLANIGSWSLDLSNNTVTWSDELYRIFGVQPSEFDHNYEAVIGTTHPEDREWLRNAIKDAIKTHVPLNVYYRITKPTGELRVLHARGAVVTDEHGNARRLHGTAQDVTERREAEEKLRATTEQLRALSASLQSAKEEEDIRIAREIHDEMGSTLTSLRWELERLDRSISASEDGSHRQDLKTKIADMMRLTDVTIGTMRRIASELRPSVLDDLGLLEAIEWQAQQFQTRTGIVCSCDCSPEDIEFDPDQSTAIFRIFQEALTNVLSHAGATRVEVMTRKDDGEFVLTISDNGRGITDDEKLASLSLGILGMRERAHLIGGELEISGVPGKGTVVSVRVPISEKANGENQHL